MWQKRLIITPGCFSTAVLNHVCPTLIVKTFAYRKALLQSKSDTLQMFAVAIYFTGLMIANE